MAIPNEARKAIYLRFLARIKNVDISCIPNVITVLDRDRITFDNEKFDEPTNGEWVRLVVRHTGRSQETLGAIGNRRFRSFGLVFVQVFTEVGARMAVADCIAEAIVDVFDDETFTVPNPQAGSGTTSLAFEAAISQRERRGRKVEYGDRRSPVLLR